MFVKIVADINPIQKKRPVVIATNVRNIILNKPSLAKLSSKAEQQGNHPQTTPKNLGTRSLNIYLRRESDEYRLPVWVSS